MSLPTKTFPGVVGQVTRALGHFNVVRHEPTSENGTGQSGVHTFIDDIVDIVLNSSDETAACRNLYQYLQDGKITKEALK